MDDLAIRAFLDLSTAHLSAATCRTLNNYDSVTAYETPYGWRPSWHRQSTPIDQRRRGTGDEGEPACGIGPRPRGCFLTRCAGRGDPHGTVRVIGAAASQYIGWLGRRRFPFRGSTRATTLQSS
jgi:hypothetical protein